MNTLIGHCQRQLARMQKEGFAIGNIYLLAHHSIQRSLHFGLGAAEIYIRRSMILEHPKLVTQTHINTHATDGLYAGTGVYNYAALVQTLFNFDIS